LGAIEEIRRAFEPLGSNHIFIMQERRLSTYFFIFHCFSKDGLRRFIVYTFTPFSRAEFVTTDSELIAIAAAAMIGFSKPKAAMGIAAVL